MKSSARRSRKYAAKLTGEHGVMPGQKSHFNLSMPEQLAAEHYVKTLGVSSILQNYYMIFAKQLLKIKKTHAATTGANEACFYRTHWASRGLDGTTLDNIVARYGFPACVPIVPVCAWNYKRKLTFTGNVSGTNLDNFPVLVHLTNANFNFAHAKTNGEDIRFIDSDQCPSDATPLKHEIENWDQAGQEAWVWVKVPRINTGVADFIYMYFDNGAAADGQDAINVWDTNFKFVQHMYDNPDNRHITGSTSFGHIGTKVAAGAPGETDAQTWKGQEFDGIDDYISVPHHSSLAITGDLTIEAWVRLVDYNNFYGVVNKSKAAGTVGPYDITTIKTTGRVRYFRGDGAVTCNINSINPVGTGVWAYIVMTSTSNHIWGYLNGNYENDGPCTITPTDWGDPLRIGRWLDNGYPFYGKMDEIRISNTIRTADWIKAQHLSMTDALITYGAEEGV